MKKIHTNQVHGHKRPSTASSIRASNTVVAAALCCVLAACGGGGSGNAGNTADNNPSPQGTSTPQATADEKEASAAAPIRPNIPDH